MPSASVAIAPDRPFVPTRWFAKTAATQTVSLSTLVRDMPLRRRMVRSREYVFRAGQSRHSLYLVHAGIFKTSILSEDGREKITGFRLPGDLLGLEALDQARFTCDAMALDVGEVWELPCEELTERLPAFQQALTGALAAEIRRDWHWMLSVATLTAEQRVVAFLLDLGSRLGALGFSAQRMTMRMTRADLGNFLGLKLETVVRALSRLQSLGLIQIEGHEIRILEANRLSTLLVGGTSVSEASTAALAA
jgi:CRP/FNR family transcriptional regulator